MNENMMNFSTEELRTELVRRDQVEKTCHDVKHVYAQLSAGYPVYVDSPHLQIPEVVRAMLLAACEAFLESAECDTCHKETG